MNLLTEVINLLRDGARAAGCDGVVMRAEISLTVSGVPVVVVVPISVPTMPNREVSRALSALLDIGFP